ncbi:MAG: GtrA family protein [Desulfovibrio sp.]|nr:GtrA family protein [Desulfovibrio sp.]
MPGCAGIAALVRGILAKRWVRFGIVGGAASVSYFLLGLLFVSVLGLPTLVGNALAYALSFIVSYLGQCLWTFRAAEAGAGIATHRAMLPRFAATQAVGLCCNSAIVWLLMQAGVPYAWAMPIAVLLVPVIVYALCKVWVFKKQASFVQSGAEKTGPYRSGQDQLGQDQSESGQPPVASSAAQHPAPNEEKA